MHRVLELLRRRRLLLNRGRLEQARAQEKEWWNWLDDLSIDLRYGVRQLFNAPAFTVLALVTLAIGVGANTALFSVMNTLLFASPPVRNPELLRQIEWSAGTQPGIAGMQAVSYPVFEELRRRSTTLSDVSCVQDGVGVGLRVQGNSEDATAQFVSARVFQTLGVQPRLGRVLASSDEEPDAAPVAVLNEAAWHRYFARDAAVVGHTVTINGLRVVIAGVVPQTFNLDSRSRYGDPRRSLPVLTLAISQYAAVTGNREALISAADAPCRLIGVQRAHASTEQTRAETERLLRNAFAAYPPSVPGAGPSRPVSTTFVHVDLRRIGRGIDQIRAYQVGRALPQALGLLLLPWAILLIPCANVAGMLLARAASRRGEIVARLALGASRTRVVRQLLTESIVLAVLGGSLGILLCYVLRNPLAWMFEMPFLVDVRVLAFTVGLSVLTGLLFGLVPALDVGRTDLVSVSKQESPLIHGRTARISKRLVTVQIALSFILVVAAGTQVQSLFSIGGRRADVDPRRVLGVQLSGASIEDPSRGPRVLKDIAARLAAVAGVESVSFSRSTDARSDEFPAVRLPVAPDFFKTMHVRMLAGRDVSMSGGKEAVVNQAFARKYFPDSNPLGHTVRGYDGRSDANGTEFTIVGIAADSDIPLAVSLPQRLGLEPTVYTSVGFKKRWGLLLLVRGSDVTATLVASVRQAIGETDPDLRVPWVETLGDMRGNIMSDRRLSVIVASSVGLMGLLQAAFGLFGMLSYFVNRRTAEIGLRMALGARRMDVLRLVIRQSTRAILQGLVIGVLVAPLVTWVLQDGSLPALGHVATLGAALFLAAVAIVAAWTPAWRATRINPLQALRHE
jgi:predicted permease